MSEIRFDRTTFSGSAAQVSAIDPSPADNPASRASKTIIAALAKSQWQALGLTGARVSGSFEVSANRPVAFQVTAQDRWGKTLTLRGQYHPQSGRVAFANSTPRSTEATPPSTPAPVPGAIRGWTAEANGQKLHNNGADYLYVYDLPPGTSLAALKKDLKRNGHKEVVFESAEGQLHVLQSTSLYRGLAGVRLPKIGETITIKDAAGATKLAGKVVHTNSDWTRWLEPLAWASGMGALQAGALTVLAVVAAPFVWLAGGTMASVGAAAATCVGLVGLTGLAAQLAYKVIRPNTLSARAVSAKSIDS